MTACTFISLFDSVQTMITSWPRAWFTRELEEGEIYVEDALKKPGRDKLEALQKLSQANKDLRNRWTLRVRG